MTKEEFIKYIASFQKQPGEFTDDEVYEIGCIHKTLPLGDRNWNELAGRLGSIGKNGLPRNGEAIRCYVKQRQNEDGTIVKNDRLLSNKTIDGITFDEFEEKTDAIKRELYLQQVKTRDTYNTYRRTLRDEARIDSIKSLISESIKSLKSLPACGYKGKAINSSAEAVMLISDMHIGMEIDNYANKYNNDIARARLMAYVDETIRLCKQNHVKRLNVCNLSDAIHGIIHVTGRIEEQEDVIEQVMFASEILAEALNKLQEAAPEVYYRSVTDNHSRVMADFKQHIEKESFCRLIDWYLQSRLKDMNVVFAKDNLDFDISKFTLMNGKIMICSHGHRDNINMVVQNYIGATRHYIDYVCLGHFHESKMKSFQGAKVFVNGSLCGSDTYSVSRRLYGDPEQTLLIFDGMTLSQHIINLKDVMIND